MLEVIKGYKIPFWKKPKQNSYKYNKLPLGNNIIIDKAINDLMDKGAVVECKKRVDQFLSPYFLVEKPDGSHRFILNLKRLNKYIKTAHFKMEDVRTATRLLSEGDYMTSIDLQDAYFLVSISKNSRKYLRFRFNNKYYEFVCLPFGLSTSPYIFTKILKPVMRSLRERGFLSVIYLDDILCIGNSYEKCLENTTETITILQNLGFVNNTKKSKLIPSLTRKYLGLMINIKNSTLRLTEEKIIILINSLKSFLLLKSCKIVRFAQLLGRLVAACQAVEYGWLYTKIMEKEKLLALEQSADNYNGMINISEAIQLDIKWWIKNLPNGSRSFKPRVYKKTVYSDASDTGWGATDGSHEIFGFWSEKESKYHINYKELMAVKNLRCRSYARTLKNATYSFV